MGDLRVKPVRLFLDANILISAARKDVSKVTRLWHVPNAELVTSEYVLAECQRNLPAADQQERLARLLLTVRILKFSEAPALPDSILLPEKDQPVLAAAIFARADFLVTGDKRHFGAWYGTTILGVGVEPPARMLELLADTLPHSGNLH